jgi:hypothetical protein
MFSLTRAGDAVCLIYKGTTVLNKYSNSRAWNELFEQVTADDPMCRTCEQTYAQAWLLTMEEQNTVTATDHRPIKWIRCPGCGVMVARIGLGDDAMYFSS